MESFPEDTISIVFPYFKSIIVKLLNKLIPLNKRSATENVGTERCCDISLPEEAKVLTNVRVSNLLLMLADTTLFELS